MLSSSLELLPELLQVLLFGTLGVVLSLGGVYVERFAFANFQSGEVVLAAWATVLGAVLISLAYVVTRDNLVPTVRDVRDQMAG